MSEFWEKKPLFNNILIPCQMQSLLFWLYHCIQLTTLYSFCRRQVTCRDTNKETLDITCIYIHLSHAYNLLNTCQCLTKVSKCIKWMFTLLFQQQITIIKCDSCYCFELEVLFFPVFPRSTQCLEKPGMPDLIKLSNSIFSVFEWIHFLGIVLECSFH